MSSAGVVFPETGPAAGEEPQRSTSALGRAVVADALRRSDPIGARAAAAETNWRRGYVTHFRRMIEAGLTSGDAERAIAADGLAGLYQRMRFVARDGAETDLDTALSAAGPVLGTEVVPGQGMVDRDFSLPYRGERLSGDTLRWQLDAWTERGVIEPSCAEAVRAVIANPDWLDLSDVRMVWLGAGAEMGPVHSLLRWGDHVGAPSQQ